MIINAILKAKHRLRGWDNPAAKNPRRIRNDSLALGYVVKRPSVPRHFPFRSISMLHFVTQVTPQLLAQLSGQTLPDASELPSLRRDTDHGYVVNASFSFPLLLSNPCGFFIRRPDTSSQETDIIRREDILRSLQRSQRIGELLLTREKEELEKINAFAEELIEREFTSPSKERPCQKEAAACLACYQSSSDDVMQCAEAVAAYSRCARSAMRDVLHTGK